MFVEFFKLISFNKKIHFTYSTRLRCLFHLKSPCRHTRNPPLKRYRILKKLRKDLTLRYDQNCVFFYQNWCYKLKISFFLFVSVQVIEKSARQKLHSQTIMVKGSELDAYQTTQATAILINFFCDTLAVSTNDEPFHWPYITLVALTLELLILWLTTITNRIAYG